MPITALSIIDNACEDTGIKAANENLSASMAQDCLRRLNRLIGALNNHNLVIPCINRAVFPVVSNQNTYTIGPGGDFDTVRPLGIVAAGLLQTAFPQTFTVAAADSATNSFTVATDVTALFTPGEPFNVTGSTANNGIYTVRSATFGTQTTIVPLETVRDDTDDGTISIATATSPVEIPIGVMTDSTYQSLVLKQLTGTMFTNVYFNATYPLATIFLSPTPNIADNDLVLYLEQQLSQFVDLTTEYAFPQGYDEMLEYQLGTRLITPYGVPSDIAADVRGMAMSALANIKRTNTKMVDIGNDAAYLTGHRNGIYNIFSDTGG